MHPYLTGELTKRVADAVAAAVARKQSMAAH
jgi:hypothetical protein